MTNIGAAKPKSKFNVIKETKVSELPDRSVQDCDFKANNPNELYNKNIIFHYGNRGKVLNNKNAFQSNSSRPLFDRCVVYKVNRFEHV